MTPNPNPDAAAPVPPIPDEELAAMLEQHAKALPTQDWAKDRTELVLARFSQRSDAVVLYDDHDYCAEFHDNLGLGCSSEEYAKFFVMAHKEFGRVVRRLRQVERENESLRKLVSQVVKHPPFDSGVVHWGRVSEIFATGATSAIALCHEFDVDPDRIEWSCPECNKRQGFRGFCCEQCRLDFEASTK